MCPELYLDQRIICHCKPDDMRPPTKRDTTSADSSTSLGSSSHKGKARWLCTNHFGCRPYPLRSRTFAHFLESSSAFRSLLRVGPAPEMPSLGWAPDYLPPADVGLCTDPCRRTSLSSWLVGKSCTSMGGRGNRRPIRHAEEAAVLLEVSGRSVSEELRQELSGLGRVDFPQK